MKADLLVLTDHSTHSEHNSLYALVRALHNTEKFASIDIASRGVKENRAALSSLETTTVYVHRSDADFHFRNQDPLPEKNLIEKNINDFDFIFLRIPRPLPEHFFDHLLSCLPANTIFNNPIGIKKTASKEYLLNFQEFTPPIAICQSTEDIKTFAEAYDTVIKPLKDYGGRGIVRLSKNSFWLGNKEYQREKYREYFNNVEFPVLSMKFMKNVGHGDKRIVMARDEILTSSLRLPAKESWLCNVSKGGSVKPAKVTEREKAMADSISSEMIKEGIVLYGFDTLEDEYGRRQLSEINTLSIGGIGPSEAMTGKPISQRAADILSSEMEKNYKE